MRPLLHYAPSITALDHAIASAGPKNRSICLRCQLRAISSRGTRTSPKATRLWRDSKADISIRHFSHEPKVEREPPATPSSTSTTTVHETPAESLPSHSEAQKWTATKRLNGRMDQLLARLALASHEINKYTGTDYSGIEALRREIRDQEALVKRRHAAVLQAKAAFDEAQSMQMKSQKEVVSLLERKNNWASEDLERYMSLIRSEHINEQAVQACRDGLVRAELHLEEARSRLERRERERYHEEQIWSDTIRRNSTWITFGLMGFNALLLLVNIGVFEPWRRKKMVKEIKAAVGAESRAGTRQSESEAGLEKPTDLETVPVVPCMDQVEQDGALATSTVADTVIGSIGSHDDPEVVADETVADFEIEQTERTSGAHPTWLFAAWNRFAHTSKDLFSERQVQVRQVDVTIIALEGAAIGASVIGLFTYCILRLS